MPPLAAGEAEGHLIWGNLIRPCAGRVRELIQAARFIAEAEMPPLAAGVTMPLLMVQGEEDCVAPAATNAELLAAVLPHARLVMLAGCGHLPEVELPSRVNDLIAAHQS
jgi:3-oxoadipate enol-lactonase